jgi:hypothetical protein
MINALGLEECMSLRKANDGFTYFGCKKSIKKLTTSKAGSTKVHFKSVTVEGEQLLTVGSKDAGVHAGTHMGATGASQEGEEIYEVSDPPVNKSIERDNQ